MESNLTQRLLEIIEGIIAVLTAHLEGRSLSARLGAPLITRVQATLRRMVAEVTAAIAQIAAAAERAAAEHAAAQSAPAKSSTPKPPTSRLCAPRQPVRNLSRFPRARPALAPGLPPRRSRPPLGLHLCQIIQTLISPLAPPPPVHPQSTPRQISSKMRFSTYRTRTPILLRFNNE